MGANAVNGVINILTKNAKDTQGAVVKVGGGSFNEVITAGRYGFQVSEDTYARVYSKYDQFGETPTTQGQDSQDDWARWRSGFRLDSQLRCDTTLTLQGDVEFVEADAILPVPSLTPPAYVSLAPNRFHQLDANMLGRWTREYADEASLSIQTYYDYFEDRNLAANQYLHTFDLDLQHNFTLGERQQINWGAGYRVTFDTLEAGQILSVPGRSQANDQLLSLFAQDEIALVLEQVFLTLGTKLEHNDYTGWEASPSARLCWQPTQKQTVWGAVSRAVTTPNHLSTGMAFNLRVAPPGALGPGSPATLVQVQGQSDRVEELLAYEIGYRIQPIERVSVDVAAFYNDYADLLATETGAVIPGTPPVLPVNWVNRIAGHTYGVEVALGWQPLDRWRLQAGYTWFESDVTQASVGRGDGDASPEHKFSLRSSVDLGAHWEWDTGLRYVGELTSVNVPAYLEMDMRLAWKPAQNWEIALVGQNLLDKSHYEFPRGLSPLLSEVPRSVYLTVTCRF
ncbi:MAG: TonB-dependent receptor [Verrucomicrobiota bacterium]